MCAKLRDRFWLWGQDAGSHHNAAGNKSWKLPGVNQMEPAEGAAYLGIKNVCRVVMCGSPNPPFDDESEKLKSMTSVVWSAIGDSGSVRNNNSQSDLGEVIRQAAMYPNVSGAVLDDFFIAKSPSNPLHARDSVENIAEMRRQLHAFPERKLDLWIVWYKHELDYEIDDYLKQFDVVTFWNMMAPAEFDELDSDIEKVVAKTPGKRRLAGFYMWNYGEGKPLSIEEARMQCELYREWIRKGYIEGIVFCSNCCADLGLEAVEWIKNWIQEVGDEVVADPVA